MHVNILAYRGCHYNYKCAIFQNIIVIDILAFPVSLTSVENHKTSFIIDKPTLVQVIWCRQAPSHHLDLWWPNSMTPNGIPKDQWVNAMAPWCQGPVSLKISHQIFQLYQLYYCYSPPIRLLQSFSHAPITAEFFTCNNSLAALIQHGCKVSNDINMPNTRLQQNC